MQYITQTNVRRCNAVVRLATVCINRGKYSESQALFNRMQKLTISEIV